MTKTRVALIGTAGRSADGKRITLSLYQKMVTFADEWLIAKFPDRSEIILVSGGAAVSDHIAIVLYLQGLRNDNPFGGLELHLPARFAHSSFVESGAKFDAGRISNHYHRVFSTRIYGNGAHTRRQIQLAQDSGAVVKIYSGFKVRNLRVGKADHLLAFTWGSGAVLADDGTAHCWAHSIALTKEHVPLITLV